MNIHRDLLIGREAENRVVGLYNSLGFVSYLNTDKQLKSLYDIVSFAATWELMTLASDYNIDNPPPHRHSFTTEVKYDIRSLQTGNIAIEIYNPKTETDSGLNITEANIWCHISNHMYFGMFPLIIAEFCVSEYFQDLQAI